MFASYVLMFCRITIALLFMFSFGSKALALRDFTVAIGDFRLLPRRWSRKITWLFLSGEIASSVLVISGGHLLPIGFLLATVLLTAFSIALLMALWRKFDMSCNCFGRTEHRISYYDVIRNMYLIVCCLIGLWILRYASQGLSSGEIVLLILMSAVILIFVTNSADVVKALCRPFQVTEERR